MSNVKSLYGGPTGQPDPNENAIAVLTEALERAKAGEVIGVVIAILHHDGLSGFRTGGMVGGYSLLGALEMAKADLIEVLSE